MCGLVGVYGEITNPERAAFKKLLQLDTIRGPHSTGVATVKKNDDVFIDKCLGTPWEFEKEFTQRFTKGKPDVGCKALIGHNRWATVGKITAENAHPFEQGDVVGAHNGTLKYRHVLDDPYQFDVDSQVLLENINKNGIKNTYPKMAGAWTLIWWDKKTQSIKIIRNKERPLYLTFSEDNKTLFWASEGWMLEVALSMYGVKHQKILTIEVDKLHEFKIGKNQKITLHKSVSYKSYTPPFTAALKTSSPTKSLNKGANSVGVNESTKLYKKWVNKYIPFYITRQGIKHDYQFFGVDLVDGHRIRLDLHGKNNVVEYLEEDGLSMGWYLGRVQYTSKDDCSETGYTLTISPTTMTEPLDWVDFTYNNLDENHDWLGLIEYNSIVSLIDYVDVLGDDLKEEVKSRPIEYDSSKALVTVDGHEMTVDELNDILGKGCGNCSYQELDVNFESIRILDNGGKTYLCSSCSKDDNVKAMCSIH